MALIKYPGMLTEINYENRRFSLPAPSYVQLPTVAKYVANSLAVYDNSLYYAPSPYMDAMEILRFESAHALEAFLYQCKYNRAVPTSSELTGLIFCIVIVEYPESVSKIIEYVNEMSTKKYKSSSDYDMNFPFSLIGVDADTTSLSDSDTYIMAVSNDYKFTALPPNADVPHKPINFTGALINPKTISVLFKSLDQYYKDIVKSTTTVAQEKVTWKSLVTPIGTYIKSIEDKSLKSTIMLKKVFGFLQSTLEGVDDSSFPILGSGPESTDVLFSKSIKKYITTRLKTLASIVERIKDEKQRHDTYDDLNVLLIAVLFCYMMHSLYNKIPDEVSKLTPYVHVYKTLNAFFTELLDKSTTVDAIPNNPKKLARVLGLIDLSTKKFKVDITEYLNTADFEKE